MILSQIYELQKYYIYPPQPSYTLISLSYHLFISLPCYMSAIVLLSLFSHCLYTQVYTTGFLWIG